jgi:hypothetical protein
MEIEYRAKTLTGEWVHGSYIKRYAKMRFAGRIEKIPTHWILPFDQNKRVEIDFSTLGLYTGRKDVNEQKIYMGDLLVGKDVSSGYTVVEYLPTTGFFLRLKKNGRRATFAHVGKFDKVAGNIHDKPELLEQLRYDVWRRSK